MYKVTSRTPDIHARALSFLYQNRKMTGARVILALIVKPGTKVELMELCRRMYHPQVSAEYVAKLNRGAFIPIPLADKKTVAVYLERIRILTERKVPGEDSAELDWEIDWLNRELRRVCRPGKGIKAEAPELKRAYTALRMGVNRLLRKAEAQDKELYLYIRSHLKTGYSFTWNREDITKADIIANQQDRLIMVA